MRVLNQIPMMADTSSYDDHQDFNNSLPGVCVIKLCFYEAYDYGCSTIVQYG